MALSPNLPDVMLSAIRAAQEGTYTALPGIIDEYDPATQTASVIPTAIDHYLDENGTQQEQSLPIIQGVPVMFPGFGTWRITFPVATGDTCLLVVSSVSITEWLYTGQLAAPLTDQRNHLSDAVAVVGLRDFEHSLSTTPQDRMSVGTDVGCTIEIYPDEVRIGGNDIGGTSSANDVVVQSALTDFMSALTTAIASAPTSAGLPALKTALTGLGTGAGWKAGTFVAKAK